jgi:hypothetical protein
MRLAAASACIGSTITLTSLAYVGRVRADGQFDILWRSRELVEPQAFSPYLRAAGGAN